MLPVKQKLGSRLDDNIRHPSVVYLLYSHNSLTCFTMRYFFLGELTEYKENILLFL